MTKLGIDTASQIPRDFASELRTLGVEFVIRYVSTPRNPKNATTIEVAALIAAGIEPKLVFETTETRAMDGAPAGKLDALAARQQAEAIGLPEALIYFAADFNAPAGTHPLIEQYIAAANAAIPNEVGVYGSYGVCEHCLDTSVCREAWQAASAISWNQSQLSARAQIWQVLNGVRLLGLPVDLNIGRF